MKVNFYENMKFNLLVVCFCLMVYYGCCYGYSTNENDTRLISSHNATKGSSSEFTSDEAWSKSQTEIMDGAIKVVRNKIGKSKNGSAGGSEAGKNKTRTGGGSKPGKDKIGSGGGSKTGKDKIGSGGSKTGKDKIGSGGSNKIGKNKIGSGGGNKTRNNKIGSGGGNKTRNNKIGSGGDSKIGKNKVGSVGGKSYNRYQYRNNSTTSYGSRPLPTYVWVPLIIVVGALFVGIVGYEYWHCTNKSK